MNGTNSTNIGGGYHQFNDNYEDSNTEGEDSPSSLFLTGSSSPHLLDSPRLDHSTPSPSTTRQPNTGRSGNLQGRTVQLKKESPVPIGGIIVLLLVLGGSIGLGFLAAKASLAPWMHKVALGGSIILGIGFTGGTVFLIVDGVNFHKKQKQYMEDRPILYGSNLPQNPQLQINQNRRIPQQREPGISQEQWNQRLQNGNFKKEANGGGYIDGPCYYDLSKDRPDNAPFAQTLNLNSGNANLEELKFLAIPHLGQYEGAGYSGNDHLMAVRLPSSQLNTFPLEIQRQFENEPNPEVYFMVFKTPEGAQGVTRNISMHAMGFPDYDRNNPHSEGTQGRNMTTDRNGIGKQKGMHIAMHDTVGINQCPPLIHTTPLTNRVQAVSLSIHTRDQTQEGLQIHLLSNNHARFAIQENTDVSSLYVMSTIGNRKIAFHALILNNVEGENGGAELLNAVGQASAQGFVQAVQNGQYINRQIKEKVAKTFGYPVVANQNNHNPHQQQRLIVNGNLQGGRGNNGGGRQTQSGSNIHSFSEMN